jgi:ferredoxin--NADP+ reductase
LYACRETLSRVASLIERVENPQERGERAKEETNVYEILEKRPLGPGIQEYVLLAPDIARVGKAGQFVVLRLHERGERIPLTIVDCDPTTGGVTLVVQEVGKSTREMGERFHKGDSVLDLAGPLGLPSDIERLGTVVCVGGGLGIAPLYPIARDLKKAGNTVLGIIGARSRDLIFYEDRMAAVCDELRIMTDDGSHGRKGYVSDALRDVLSTRRDVARVWAIGPAIMMKVCVAVTKEFDVPTVVSLNSVMIDGTGMCGGCRVEVGGATKFACVDGPEFDGHGVDFDLLMSRQKFYAEEEACSLERYLATRKDATTS